MDLVDDEHALEEIGLLASVCALVATCPHPDTVELDEALGVHQQPPHHRESNAVSPRAHHN